MISYACRQRPGERKNSTQKARGTPFHCLCWSFLYAHNLVFMSINNVSALPGDILYFRKDDRIDLRFGLCFKFPRLEGNQVFVVFVFFFCFLSNAIKSQCVYQYLLVLGVLATQISVRNPDNGNSFFPPYFLFYRVPGYPTTCTQFRKHLFFLLYFCLLSAHCL